MNFNKLKKVLSSFGDVIFEKNFFKVLIDEGSSKNRKQVLEQISKRLKKPIVDHFPRYSNIGYVEYDDFKIIVKPKNWQGKNSYGLKNESIFIDNITKYFTKSENPVNIHFVASENDREFWANNIVFANITGNDTKDHSKSDIEFVSSNNFVYKISLKKDNSMYWESSDNFGSTKAKSILEKALSNTEISLSVSLKNGKIPFTTNEQLVLTLSHELYTEASDDERKLVIFGKDILPENGCVIKKSFKDEDFQLNENTIIVNCTKIFCDIDDVKNTDEDVIFLLRNDSSRNSTDLGVPGIRMVAAYKKRATTNSVKIDV